MLRTKTRNILTGCRKSVLGGAHISSLLPRGGHNQSPATSQLLAGALKDTSSPQPSVLGRSSWGLAAHLRLWPAGVAVCVFLPFVLAGDTQRGCHPAGSAAASCCSPDVSTCWATARSEEMLLISATGYLPNLLHLLIASPNFLLLPALLFFYCRLPLCNLSRSNCELLGAATCKVLFVCEVFCAV